MSDNLILLIPAQGKWQLLHVYLLCTWTLKANVEPLLSERRAQGYIIADVLTLCRDFGDCGFKYEILGVRYIWWHFALHFWHLKLLDISINCCLISPLFEFLSKESWESTEVNHEAKVLFFGRQDIFILELCLKSFLNKDPSHPGYRSRAFWYSLFSSAFQHIRSLISRCSTLNPSTGAVDLSPASSAAHLSLQIC